MPIFISYFEVLSKLYLNFLFYNRILITFPIKVSPKNLLKISEVILKKPLCKELKSIFEDFVDDFRLGISNERGGILTDREFHQEFETIATNSFSNDQHVDYIHGNLLRTIKKRLPETRYVIYVSIRDT